MGTGNAKPSIPKSISRYVEAAATSGLEIKTKPAFI
jgi:hypothetical protein